MTCIQIFTILFLTVLAASAGAKSWEHEVVYIRESNETKEALLEKFEGLVEQQLPGVCWMCKWLIRKARKSIGNDNPESISNKIKRACDSIGFLKSLCKKFIGKFREVIVEELSTTDDDRTICVNLKACKPKEGFLGPFEDERF